jgi:hypothetical protein
MVGLVQNMSHYNYSLVKRGVIHTSLVATPLVVSHLSLSGMGYLYNVTHTDDLVFVN